MVLKYSNLAFVFKKARIDYITDLVISTLFVIRLFATENIVLFHILKIYSKKNAQMVTSKKACEGSRGTVESHHV